MGFAGEQVKRLLGRAEQRSNHDVEVREGEEREEIWRKGESGRERKRERGRGKGRGRGREDEGGTHHCPLGGWRVVQTREKEKFRRDSDTMSGITSDDCTH